MKVVGYIRVSTKEQAKSGLGLEAQERKIRGYCELYELELVDIVVDDGYSGKTLNRPGLRKMLNYLETGKAEGVIVAKLDRLTRSVADMGWLINKYFQNYQLFSVSEQVDTRTAGGRLVLNVLISVAQWERETIAERTRDALESKRVKGEKTGGDVPYGYKEQNGKLVKDPEEQKVIKLIKILYSKGWGSKRIASYLNRNGYTTKRGFSFTHTQVLRILKRENKQTHVWSIKEVVA